MKAKNLKMKRVRAEVSQARVAALLGVSQTVLYSIESGRRRVTDDEAAAVIKAIELAATGKTGTLVPLDGGGEVLQN